MIPSDYLKIYTAEPGELANTALYEKVYRQLPAFRKQRADKYNNENVRLESVAAFGLLIYALKQAGLPMDRPSIWDELDCRVTEKGKSWR